MSVLKCKMCGGNVIFESGATIGICDSCGTRQTLPRIDDDRKNLLLDRANHFRRNGEFDKASALFEQLINEGALDADIYWSLVLCKYGIQYVKDPATGRQVPTINRAQYTPVTSDGDYKQALSLADAYQRELYESEAHEIDEIQKGILAISQKEEPFDVFICYKENDDAGRRTKDSVLAQELYYELKERGFKVFFSRITLEDKLGEQYEPYIFAAINSAKVMVVLGTKPEYFNAVWVKNEWSRFLLLIKQGKKKMLIPAYRDMDPYELPEEFVTLQAQDMSKLGFVQDLVRGIEKITGANKTPVNNGMATPAQTLSQASNKTLSAMLDRGFLSLEDGEFDKAAAFFEDALNIDARNARAYFGLSLVDFKKKTAQELAASTCVISDNKNFKKALRFADAQAIEGLNKIVDATIANRKEQERADIYQRALNKLQQAKSNGDGDWYKEASILFAQVPGYKSADELTEKCMTAAKNSWYAKGEKLMKQGVLNFHQDSFYDAIKSFSKCGEYKDVKEQVAKCQYEIAHIPAYLAAQKLIKDSKTWNNNSIPTLEKIVVALKKTAGYRDADKLLAEYEKLLFDAQQKKNNKKLHVKRFMVIGLPIIVVVTVLAILLATVFIPLAHYNTAKSAMEGGNYVKAYQEYSKANWKDSEEQAAIAQHNALSQALNLLLCGSSSEATDVLINTGYDPDIYNIAAIIRVCNIKKITIPDGVTEIPGYAFLNCCDLEEVVIPNSVTKIGDAAFSGCSKLTSVNIPDGVTIIGDGTFYNCFGLTSLVIPNSVTTIGANAFSGCNHLGNINIPNGVTVIGEGAFSNCSSFTLITIPDGITVIKSNTFNCCSGLPSITIPNNVKTIEGAAFHNCTGLTSISIPDSVTSLDERAFTNCTGIKNISGNAINAGIVAKQCGGSAFTVTITSGTSVGANAFKNCSGLASVIIENSILSIENSAFSSCTGLTSVNIPDSVTSIKSYAFSVCRSLISITIPDSVISIGDPAFNACTGLKTINGNATNTAIVASQCGATGYTINITSGEAITSSTFANLSALKSINIPATITSIEEGAFANCSSLNSINIEENNPNYIVINNCLIETSSKKLLFGVKNATIPTDGSVTKVCTAAFKNRASGSVVIPATITNVGDNAFANCSTLTSVTVESPTTIFGLNVFDNTNNIQTANMPLDIIKMLSRSNLKTVVLTNGMAIGDEFTNCNKLQTITIPNSVTTIAAGAFSGCSSLQSMTLPFIGGNKNATESSPSTVLGYIFGETSYTGGTSTYQQYIANAGKTYYIPSTLTTIYLTGDSFLYGAFYGCKSLTNVVLSGSPVIIPGSAFSECQALLSVDMPESLTEISGYAFSGCTKLSDVNIPDSVTSIGAGAFLSCSGIKKITASITNASTIAKQANSASSVLYSIDIISGDAIPAQAFLYCSKLNVINLPNTVTSIGVAAFYGCSYLETINIPQSITEISNETFYGCESLNNISLYNGITSIGSNAFYNCSSLSSINLPNEVSNIGAYAFYGCESLESINIPSLVTSLNAYTFKNCSSLTQLIMPDSVTSIGIGICAGCLSLNNLRISESITNIPGESFNDCTGLAYLYVPDSVTIISEGAFKGCFGLKEVSLPFVGKMKNSASAADSLFGTIFGKTSLAGNTYQYYNGASYNEYSIPRITDVTIRGGQIYYGSFYNCTVIQNVTLIGVTGSIASRAFYGCRNLVTFVNSNSITSIENEAFTLCSMLETITLGDGLISIGRSAFEDKTLLKNIIWGDSLKEIGKFAFSGCSQLTSIVLPDTITDIEYGAFSGCSSLTNLELNDGLICIGGSAFSNCTSLQSLTIPDSVTELGTSFLYGSNHLQTLCIGNGITAFQSGTLAGCGGLLNLTLPFVGDVIRDTSSYPFMPFGYIFGSNSYEGAVAVKQEYQSASSATTQQTYYIPSSLRSVSINGGEILDGAFSCCSMIESIVLPDGATYIGDLAFTSCSSLSSLYVPKSVNYIGEAFWGDNLTIKHQGTASQFNSIDKADHWNFSATIAVLYEQKRQ